MDAPEGPPGQALHSVIRRLGARLNCEIMIIRE
jgi:hypothetical protein